MNSAVLMLLLHAVPGAGLQTAPDTAVVCPQEFRAALQPWLAYRLGQGHTFTFISNLNTAESIRQQVHAAARLGNLRFLLLVGDADPLSSARPDVRARSVPTHLAVAKIIPRFGGERAIATDNWYADLDDDHLPDLAVGRLTVDSPAELSVLIGKIIAYEQNLDFGLWRRRLNFVAGLGGFGSLADATLEAATKKLIGDGVPGGYATNMTYASWGSPYCPDPRGFRREAIRRLDEGCLFWVYIGHGQANQLDGVRVPGGAYPIFGDADARLLAGPNAAIACFLACYTGAFDRPRDCLAEDLLRAQSGPVAVLCGSRVTMPYAMSVLGGELLEACFAQRAKTLGEAMLIAKRGMAGDKPGDENRMALDSLATLISPGPVDLAGERIEHLHLFNLLGDPALRLTQPGDVLLTVPGKSIAGKQITISGISPIDGKCTVELVVRRDRLTFAPPRRATYNPASAALAAFDDVYRQANDPRLHHQELAVAKGRFAATLDVPATAHGLCQVRVFVEGQSGFALGSADVEMETADEGAD